MSTVKFFVATKLLADVMADMMKSRVKYYPVRRAFDNGMGEKFVPGYHVEMDYHPIVSYLMLKYDLKNLNEA